MKAEAFSATPPPEPHHPTLCIDGSPVSPSACPRPVNDSLHFTLQEPRKTLWPFAARSEEIDQARERRCDRAVWLCRSWLSWCGEELAQDKHVRNAKRPYFFSHVATAHSSPPWKSQNPKSLQQGRNDFLTVFLRQQLRFSYTELSEEKPAATLTAKLIPGYINMIVYKSSWYFHIMDKLVEIKNASRYLLAACTAATNHYFGSQLID